MIPRVGLLSFHRHRDCSLDGHLTKSLCCCSDNPGLRVNMCVCQRKRKNTERNEWGGGGEVRRER